MIGVCVADPAAVGAGVGRGDGEVPLVRAALPAAHVPAGAPLRVRPVDGGAAGLPRSLAAPPPHPPPRAPHQRHAEVMHNSVCL